MTEQELLEIKTELEHSEIPRPSQEKILEACRKQVEERPNNICYLPYRGYHFGFCPDCDKGSDSRTGFCGNCGKNLKWR